VLKKPRLPPGTQLGPRQPLLEPGFAPPYLVAFLLHTALTLCDELYQAVWTDFGSQVTFFNVVRTLTRYLCFDSS